MLEATTTADGRLLEAWLTMLGWQIELARDGRIHVGVARHVARDGRSLAVGASAASRSEAIWQLFDGAMRQLDGDEATGDASAVAAA